MSDQKIKEAVNTRTVTEAGSDAAQKGAQSLQGKTTDMAEMVRRTSQEAAQRTSENLELMKRLAETMAEWAKQASKQQQEATRQLIQARSIEEVLETQNRYVRENLQSLLDFSAKVLHRSAERVSEASGQLQKDKA
jgi:predicted transcriptional regulator